MKVLELRNFVDPKSYFLYLILVENTHSPNPRLFVSLSLLSKLISLNLLSMSHEPRDVHILK